MKNKKPSPKIKSTHINQYFKEFSIPFAAALIAATIGSIASILGPNRLSEIADVITEGIQGTIDTQRIGQIGMFLATIYIIGALMSYAHGFIIATVTQRFSNKLRRQVSEKINKIPLNYFDSHKQGDILSRVTNDLDTVAQSLNQSLGNLAPAVTLLVGCTIMMFITDWRMSLTAIISALVGFILVGVILSKSQKFFASQQSGLAQISSFAEEVYTGHSVVATYNAQKQIKEEFDGYNQNLFNSVWKAQFLSGIMMPMMFFIGNFSYVMVCVVGAILVLNDTITFGVIVAFMVYIRLFTNPLSQLAQSFSSLQSAKAALGRVFEFLDEEEQTSEVGFTQQLQDTKGQVSFKNVNFGYLPNQTIIHDFSVEAKAGQKIAIVGPTGAGKTTLVNLLMKFYNIDKGDILIDGKSILSMTREEVHDQFCMVLQDTWLFEGTIKENLIFNQTDISDQKVIDACKAVGIHYFITTLPNGYDTVLDDNVELSAGQKQLLTIARALIKQAPMLILDEATSSVDTRTEVLIQNAMDKLMEGKTSFVIAHRLSTIRNADKILVMDHGDVIEQGTHDELIQLNGVYAELYNSQFANS